MANLPSKYELYEAAVQSPEQHVHLFSSIYSDLFGRPARHLREDFCGTFALSCAWVKDHPLNAALGIDKDPEPLAYGHKVHLPTLTANQRKRVRTLKRDVTQPTRERADLVTACNFSIFELRTYDALVKYLRSVHRSLKSEGLLLLEIAGGPGLINPGQEKKTLNLPSNSKTKRKFKFSYIWDQQSFDPITGEASFAIHFTPLAPKGRRITGAFNYHWRLWSIPELRAALNDAGFSKSFVYWETHHHSQGTGEFARSEKGDNVYSWIAYVAGVR